MNDLFEQSEMLRELLTTIGVAVYGKERWVEQDDDTWFDLQSGERISLYEVVDRATKAMKPLYNYCPQLRGEDGGDGMKRIPAKVLVPSIMLFGKTKHEDIARRNLFLEAEKLGGRIRVDHDDQRVVFDFGSEQNARDFVDIAKRTIAHGADIISSEAEE